MVRYATRLTDTLARVGISFILIEIKLNYVCGLFANLNDCVLFVIAYVKKQILNFCNAIALFKGMKGHVNSSFQLFFLKVL